MFGCTPHVRHGMAWLEAPLGPLAESGKPESDCMSPCPASTRGSAHVDISVDMTSVNDSPDGPLNATVVADCRHKQYCVVKHRPRSLLAMQHLSCNMHKHSNQAGLRYVGHKDQLAAGLFCIRQARKLSHPVLVNKGEKAKWHVY